MSVFAICILSSSEVQLLQDNGDVRGRPALQIAVAAISAEARCSKSWKTALVLVLLVHKNILLLVYYCICTISQLKKVENGQFQKVRTRFHHRRWGEREANLRVIFISWFSPKTYSSFGPNFFSLFPRCQNRRDSIVLFSMRP